MSFSRLPAFVLLSLVVVSFVSVREAFAVSEASASLVIGEAENEMVSAYEAIREAELAGADVSGFSELVGDAAQLLAQARTAFTIGDFDRAERFANLTIGIGTDVKGKAVQLRELQRGMPVWQMWQTIVQSFLAVAGVVLASLWSWGRFKRRYYRRVRDLKPEVASHES
jgi:hypothetical protein